MASISHLILKLFGKLSRFNSKPVMTEIYKDNKDYKKFDDSDLKNLDNEYLSDLVMYHYNVVTWHAFKLYRNCTLKKYIARYY